MFAVILKTGEVCTEQKRILHEQAQFYGELYKSDPGVKFELKNQTNKKLDAIQQRTLDEDLSIEELHKATMSMKRNKTPGLDGLTLEFYLKFFEVLGPWLMQVYETAYKKGFLNPSAHKGLITLIPKKDKDCIYLKNMQPLTLLNLDYKILSCT